MTKRFFENIDYNKVLLESDNFIVIPSLGSLVEGWLLIIPKNFYINLSQLDSKDLQEMQDLIYNIEKDILPCFGKDYVLFEHGPASLFSKAGCGVDYAHLHLVPGNWSLKEGLTTFLDLEYNWTPMSGLTELNKFRQSNSDYLLIKDQDGKFSITFQETIQSQTFRKVIAHYLNIPDKFDWKSNHGKENIKMTISKLKPEFV